MCLAASKGRSPSKTSFALPLIQQVKQVFPAISKALKAKPRVQANKSGIENAFKTKAPNAKLKPRVDPRPNPSVALDILFCDSCKAFPPGHLFLVPRATKKDSNVPCDSCSPFEAEYKMDSKIAPTEFSTPRPKETFSMSPPPIPRPGLYMDQDISIPETIWLPSI